MVSLVVICLICTFNENVCRSSTYPLRIEYRKRKHFHSWACVLMTGDEREEGSSEAPRGRETNPPDARMKRCERLTLTPYEWSASNFSLSYQYIITHTGHENLANDHQRWIVLIFEKVLPISNQQNLWRKVRRICIMVLGLKGLKGG